MSADQACFGFEVSNCEPALEVPGDVRALLAADAPVAIGVSGGKDSAAAAIAVCDYLKTIGHGGPKLLVHAHLGSVEWRDSLPACNRLHRHLQLLDGEWQFHQVARKAGGMMERWESRWQSSIDRYVSLSCVKLILPWSTPSMRFCTSELKSAPIASFLKKLFGKQPVVSVTGIRAQESANRAKMPASKANPRLAPGSLDWNPILRWQKDYVFTGIRRADPELLHEAYTRFGSSRVSCAFCIMASMDDLRAALRDGRNHLLYRRMCELELASAFAFQGGKWLSEIGPFDDLRERLPKALAIAQERQSIESRIPKHLEFTAGWPEVMPSTNEAQILADVRSSIGHLYGLPVRYTTADTILSRYEELFRLKQEKRTSL